jgi:hypothetical protein
MITFLLIVAIWAFVAVSCHYRRNTYYRKHPYMWERRKEGLISFTDRQYWWIMTLWPLAIVAFVLFMMFIGLCALVEFIQLWRAENRRRR